MKNKLFSPLTYKNNSLHFDGISIESLAKKYPTPFYLYSSKTLEYYFLKFKNEALANSLVDPLICFAVKSNANLEILKRLKKLGAGADVVSVGELKQALKAGISAEKIVFSGVAKTEEEITFALTASKNGIYSFNVESIEELNLINQVSKKLKLKARVAFRFNPEVNVKTHKHISTGNKTHKFGILKSDILEALEVSKFWTHTKLVGLSIHIGSQLTSLSATIKAIKEISDLALQIETINNTPFEFLDFGGGLGIDYTEKDLSTLASIEIYMEKVSKAVQLNFYKKTQFKNNLPKIVFEPGRIIVGKMGVLVSKVIRTKTSDNCHFTIIDAGMNDLIRPALYDAYHEVYPAKNSTQKILTDIVGPICETSDCFGQKRSLPRLESGDFVVIENAGAYGHTMASTYNLRTIAKEIIL